MNTRRKFLLQSSVATTGLLIADPFKNFANTVSSITGIDINERKLALVHTGPYFNERHATDISSFLKKNTGNIVLLHAGPANEFYTAYNNYHASIHENKLNVQYKIVYKGDIKIAVVNVNKDETNLTADLNKLCTQLKKEKKCRLVVCLSQLGYNNEQGMDDRKLAKQSAGLDVIIGAHPSNFPKHPIIAQNNRHEEVIIHSAANNLFGLGNIEFGFDKNKNKNAIAFNNIVRHQLIDNG